MKYTLEACFSQALPSRYLWQQKFCSRKLPCDFLWVELCPFKMTLPVCDPFCAEPIEQKMWFSHGLMLLLLWKIAGRKCPALVDPSHKVCEGGKGIVDRRTDRRTDGYTSGPLPVHFWYTSGPLNGHWGGLGWSGLSPAIPGIPNWIYIHKGKNMTPKDPLRINAWDLKTI